MAHRGIYTSIESRFFKKVKIDSVTQCWEWQSNKSCGYGNFYYKKRQWKAHRISYIYYIGEIPEGMNVLHSCDNPGCVSPFHIFIGTQLDNMHDMIKKGRYVPTTNMNTHLIKHPSIAAYRIRKCRCEGCRAIKSAESKRLYKKKK